MSNKLKVSKCCEAYTTGKTVSSAGVIQNWCGTCGKVCELKSAPTPKSKERKIKDKSVTFSMCKKCRDKGYCEYNPLPLMSKQSKKAGYAIVQKATGEIYDVCPKKPKFKGDKVYKVVPCTITYHL